MKCNFLKIEKHFVNASLNISNLYQIFNILKKQMTLIAYVLPKLETVKDMVRRMFR